MGCLVQRRVDHEYTPMRVIMAKDLTKQHIAWGKKPGFSKNPGFKLLYAHNQGFPLRLLDLLSQPQEGLHARVTNRQDINAPRRRNGAQATQSTPQCDAWRRARLGR